MIRPGTSRLSSCTLALLLALASCSKLPKETTSGAHTFGCRVDGKAWNTYTEHTLDNAIEAEYDTGFFTLSAERDTKKRGGRIFLQLADSAGFLYTRTYTGAAGGFTPLTSAMKTARRRFSKPALPALAALRLRASHRHQPRPTRLSCQAHSPLLLLPLLPAKWWRLQTAALM